MQVERTESRAYTANLKSTHESLVAAKGFICAAIEQTDDPEAKRKADAIFRQLQSDIYVVQQMRFG